MMYDPKREDLHVMSPFAFFPIDNDDVKYLRVQGLAQDGETPVGEPFTVRTDVYEHDIKLSDVELLIQLAEAKLVDSYGAGTRSETNDARNLVARMRHLARLDKG